MSAASYSENAFTKRAGRLIALSNRTAIDPNARAGGLAVALWDALVASNGLWVGWSGQLKDFPSRTVQSESDEGVDFALRDMSKKQYEGFYLGYSNSALWPLMHNRLDLAVFKNSDFDMYKQVNLDFAETLSDLANPEDFIWVHDYHFFLVAYYMRRAGWGGEMGYFLHIPFPAPEIFRALPQHDFIARALCDYDVLGFQTANDVENFKRLLREDCGGQVGGHATEDGCQQYEVFGRIITIKHCPIGINAAEFTSAAQSKSAVKAAAKLDRFLGGRQLIIGVDRMDYSKGLPQRFEAVGRLFDNYPETHGTTSFTQIAPPSRSLVDEYIQLRETLDQLSGRINGDYGDLDWIPIRYLARGYGREEIAGLFRMAQVCLVTPLQDGMNLVAKEFIAAQDPDDPGVLILSQFAGAAEQMTDALIVNPHDTEAVAKTIKTALDMPLAERVARWTSLYSGVCSHDIAWWQEHFFKPVKCHKDQDLIAN